MSFEYAETGHSPTRFRIKSLPVFFSDEKCLDIIKNVLDEKGNIKNYPGIIEDERWIKKKRIGTFTDVRFEAQFHTIDSKEYLMLWMIQPNGWHWVDDDGFGFTGDSSITLFSVLDQDGNFTKKFELFSIDGTKYCHDYDEYMK